MSNHVRLSADAAVVLGLAATAIPFARSPEEQAERWLRLLRLHGEAGATLGGLGVGETPVSPAAAMSPLTSPPRVVDALGDVTAHAAELAGSRGDAWISTGDILLAVISVYGQIFDRVLAAHGSSRADVVERLNQRLGVIAA